MPSEKEFDDGHAITQLVYSGAGATGVAAGSLLGFLAGGPEGAAAGGATSALLQDSMKGAVGELARRLSAQSERVRVGSCMVLAHQLIAQRLNDGEPLRDPGFFKPRERRAGTRLRSEAEELLEGTFLAARDSYEEKKVELLARFYASAAFEQRLDVGTLYHVLSLAKSLTYRQLVLIGIIGVQHTNGPLSGVRDSNFRGTGELPLPTVGVLYEIFQLVGLDLVQSSSGEYILGVADINPSQLRLQGTGAQLFNLLRPDLIAPLEDTAFFSEAFVGT